MRKFLKYAFVGAIALTGFGLVSCSSDDDLDNPNGGVTSEEVKTAFTISFPSNVISTKQTAATVQDAGTTESFRGLDDFYLIPFGSAITAGTETKIGSIIELAGFGKNDFDIATANAKVYTGKTVPVGTNHFLFYAKAQDGSKNATLSTVAEKHQYGTLAVKTATTDGILEAPYTKASDITFAPVQINTVTTTCAGSAKGQALITLLNSVENAEGKLLAADASNTAWSAVTEAQNPLLYQLYQNLITLKNASSYNVQAALEDLYVSLNDMASNASNNGYGIATAIRTAISGACATAPAANATTIGTLKSDYTGYPADVNLPDGAAQVNFSAGAFAWAADQVHSTQLNVTAVDNYVYPAHLWYFANSTLKTRTTTPLTDHEGNGKTWEEILTDIYGVADAGTQVAANTRSVVMNDQAQYAVGRLDATVAALNANKYYDKKGEEVNVTNGFTLKGVLVGGQKSVDWQFLPVGTGTWTVYDNALDASGTWNVKNGTASSTNYTLLLETAAGETELVALEFVNNGGDFQGADGVIPAGGTFYMVASLDPANATNKTTVTHNTVFKQDYKTQVTFTIGNGTVTTDPATGTKTGTGGLATATNGIPDLRTPTVELGLSVNLQWQQGLTFNAQF